LWSGALQFVGAGCGAHLQLAELVCAACQSASAQEAITSRPLLLRGVVRLSEHAGQPRLLLTVVHGASDKIKQLIGAVRAGLDYIRATAP